MDSPILHEPFETDPRDLAANGIEAADDDDAGRVIDDDVNAGRLFEAADVPPLAADHSALHVVAGNRHGADSVIGSLLRCVALNRLQDDLPALFLRFFGGLFGH